MDFRTIINPINHCGKISHDRPLLMMGSCFSDNIGAKLQNALFNVEINPFGTLYNPASIASAVTYLIEERKFLIDDLFEHDGRFHSFNHHSNFSGTDAHEVVNRINHRISNASAVLKSATALIVTFGTAYVYTLVADNSVVSNCHKLPSEHFNRRRMSINEIVQQWNCIINNLVRLNPDLQIIFTVSPIRHLADGAHDNQLSKSTLLLAVDQLCAANERSVYFPSFEIMMDDLRDYRFYAADMTHPSETAVNYIYDIFANSFFSETTKQLTKECEKLTRRMRHRFMTDDATVIERFNHATDQIKQSLLMAHPYLKQAIDNISTK